MISEKRNVPGCQASPRRTTERSDGSRADCKLTRLGLAELRRQFAQHADIVRGLEAFGEDERLAADLDQRIFEFGDAVGGIDIDEDEPGFGGGELRQHPFAVVRRPDADAIAGIKAEREEPGGKLIDGLPQLAIGEADLLVTNHQRRTRCPFCAGFVEELPDGFADQRLIAGAMHIAELESGHLPFLPSF